MGGFRCVHFFLVLELLVIHKYNVFNDPNSVYFKFQFRSVTPYSAPPSRTDHPIADEVHVQSSAASLDDWLHPSGSNTSSAQQVMVFLDGCNTAAASSCDVFCLFVGIDTILCCRIFPSMFHFVL